MPKNCFIDKARPCDLTCKAAFPVDDPVDPVDCYFIWLAGHVGDSAIDFRQMLEGKMPGGAPSPAPPGSGKGKEDDPGGTDGPGGTGPTGLGGTSPN